MTVLKYTVEAPSNIAFVKYWGKRDAALQWPANDSVSMTLSNCKTITSACVSDVDQMIFNEREIPNFSDSKQKKFLDRIRRDFGFDQPLKIETKNTFPDSCGIASSASGYAALTVAAISAWSGSDSFEKLSHNGFSRERLAEIARLGSGSACRSLFGGFVHWKAGPTPQEQKVTQIADESWSLSDLVVVLSSDKKDVSSSDGHQSVWTNPAFKDRLKDIYTTRLPEVLRGIQEKNLSHLGKVIEEDAVNMHEISESAVPPVAYRSEKTLKLQDWVKKYRNISGLDVYFTIDAGPNVHLICLHRDSQEIERAVKDTFSDATIIRDHVGSGPTLNVHG